MMLRLILKLSLTWGRGVDDGFESVVDVTGQCC